MTTTITGHTLPVTRRVLGNDRWRVSSKQTMQGREGEACNAKVRLDNKIVGEITDDGNGGGAWFRGHSREANVAWDELITQTRLARGLADDAYIVEGVCEDLLCEYDITKEVKKPNRTVVVATPAEGEDLEFYGMCIVNHGPDEGTFEYIRTKARVPLLPKYIDEPPYSIQRHATFADGLLYWSVDAQTWIEVPA